MPTLRHQNPRYRKHKASGQASVTLNGRDFYLGPHGTKASRAEYDRLIGEWLTGGRRLPATSDLTVAELIARYWRRVTGYYVKKGRPTSEQHNIKRAMIPLRQLYGDRQAADFSPLALKAVRQAFVDAGRIRGQVNKMTGRIKRMFKWATENELVPASVYHGLQAVAGLKAGRSAARESEPVKPVPPAYVDAIRPHISRQAWAMIQMQRLTGMRSSEVTAMRSCDLDMTGDVWTYKPRSHKTEHHGHERIVDLGPRAQAVVRPFLKSDVEAFLFSPADAEAERRARMHAERKTPLSCGNRPGTNCKRQPRKRPRDRYTPGSYARAIAGACKKADVPHWHPHQLRHLFATEKRKRHGIEAVRALLGQKSVAVAELYGEIDRGKCRSIMAAEG